MSTIAINSFVHTSWVDPERSSHRQLLHYQYEDHLTETTQPNIYRKFQPENDYGWTSLAYNVSGMAMKPKTARSYPSLLRKIEKEGFQYYRPNLSYTSQSHMKRKLRWMVGLFFDFDAKHLQVLGIYQPAQLLQHIESFGFSVYGIIKTTSGYHAYLPMQSLRGCWNGQKTIKRYDLVMKRIARMIGSDINAASAEHYFRTPQPTNVVYFKPVEKPSFEWYEEKVIEKVTKSATPLIQPSFGRLMSQPAMLKLLAGDFDPAAVADGRKLGRNNAAFTLALGMKADGWSREQATQELHNWYNYRINCEDFPLRELDRVISQAFEKDYKAPSPLFVEAMTGLKLRPISRKVAEADRKRMPYKQTEEKLIEYLKRYYQEFKKDLMLSQAKLAEALNVSLRSLQSVLKALKEKDQLTIETKRIGRSNVSIYFLDAELLKHEDEAPESLVIEDKQVLTASGTRSQSNGYKTLLDAAADLRVYAAIHNAISCTYILLANGCLGLRLFCPLPLAWRIQRDRYDE